MRCTRLTEGQKKRCTDSHRIAVRVAKRLGRKFHVHRNHDDALLSQAQYGLVVAASKFDPGLSPNGEEGWGPYAAQMCKWAVYRLFHEKLDVALCGYPLTEEAVESLEDGRTPPPGRILELRDEVGRCLAAAGAYAPTLEAFLRHKTTAEVARDDGVTHSAIRFRLLRVAGRVERERERGHAG
jgi:hypothetical protein